MNDKDGVLLRVNANLWRGREAVGGRLTLTRDCLSFRAHALNIQTEPLDLPLGHIASVQKYNHLRIIPNGLSVTTTSGAVFHFVLFKRDRIVAAIEASRL
ncbi:GRAM domain-containing protein [Dactylosporangium sp. NBC_01737]|uniref:GRAM domain-containing protein n=1 Tax=Dactylosporangium sp. NBC_01737 TaxID=2975959 RepID=UPI002E0D2AD7|nr:GRAM domain-containing protein [Dactylosporangium sp. NBC_01737]